ncbi:N-acetylgalactosamine kinase-like [Orbicella faveolata]|uniref:N-acetylgalactosamine kinase-like n=1 Tax=Orbicella faveolata TaxID=48498 RepID=UPI0009E49FE7|nr:N-acetylgalactosamine kinase-like [Orbicella faveolata]
MADNGSGVCSPPLFSSLEKVYFASTAKATSRYEKIKGTFLNKYGSPPEFYARAPGRVNIIGEHIDYCGYGVLPMAVEQDIVIAVAPNDQKTLNISNTFNDFQDFSTSCEYYKIDGKEWYHYFLCGYKGLLDHMKITSPVGLNLVVDGTVPKSAGLSSSSALVCCSGLATVHANGLELSKHELAEVCTKCERYIGTEGGGMDQSISFLAEPGTAKHIEFDPIRAYDVTLPDGIVFVIANSLVEMKKSATAGTHFNARVVECRLAAKVLAKESGLDWKSVRRLSEVQQGKEKSLDEMVQMVDSCLHSEPYTKEELCKFFELSEEELINQCMSPSTAGVNSFKLHDRAKHVYSEASRVLKFKNVCEEKPANAVQVLGGLMNESHDSCSKMYECSCEELDQLVNLCRQAGAVGSRLTGAGWGGCTVSLVPVDVIDDFMKKVHDGYYAADPEKLQRVSESLFVTQPGSGAAILKLN